VPQGNHYKAGEFVYVNATEGECGQRIFSPRAEVSILFIAGAAAPFSSPLSLERQGGETAAVSYHTRQALTGIIGCPNLHPKA
jgi:hypothetical protein